jgi:tetratricopeptide (TPR) repeat protein
MINDKEQLFEDNDLQAVMNKYNDMLAKKKLYFFDVHEFESIIEFYTNAFNLNKASEAVNYAIQQHPSASSIKLKKAQILIDKGQVEKGLEYLNNIEGIESSNYEFYILKGNAYAIKGDINKALNFYNFAVSMYTDDKAEVCYNVAVSLEHLCFFEEAATYLEKAIALEPENTSYLFDLAYCLEHTEDLDKCVNVYKNYLDVDPFSEHVWHSLGMVYSKMDKFDEAIEAYEFALAIDENYATAHFNLANSLANSGKFYDAIEQYLEFSRIEPDNIFANYYLGECYEQIKENQLAKDHYKKAIQIDEQFADAWYAYGCLLRSENKLKQSLKYLKKALELDKDNLEYTFSFGILCKDLGKFDLAADHFRNIVNQDPFDDDTWLLYSEVYSEQDDFIKAIEIIHEALHHNPSNSLLNYRLAAYYWILHNRSNSYYYFEKGLQTNVNECSTFFEYLPSTKSNRQINKLIRKYHKKTS